MPDIPLKLSVSKTKVWSACRKQFEYTYVLKLPRIERDYHVFGKFCHKALEDFHLAYINNSILPPNEVMRTAFQAAKAEYASKMTPASIKEAFDILSSYLRLVSTKSSGYTTRVLSAEEAFNFQLTDRIILNGFIDKVAVDDDGITHISDYKTTKQRKYLLDDWFQLMTYAFVIMHNKPELDRVRVSYVLLRHDFEHISRDVSREEAESVKAQYEQFALDIEQATEYPATTSQLCRFCDHIDICSEGLKSIGKEARHGEIDW